MSSIQVRIDKVTHTKVQELAKDLGESMQGVVEQAIERFRREVFLENLSRDFENLRSEPDAWNAELAERELWEATLSDGDDG